VLRDNPAWLDEAVTPEEASRITGVPVCTLATWRSRGGGPLFVKLGGRSVRYQRRDLFTWLASRRRANTADRGGCHG
jgi:predicted DNA-binding transcriptional regulator AlpA